MLIYSLVNELLVAPFSTILGTKYSMRCAAMTGAVLCVSGTFLSFFATSMIHLILTFGLLTGEYVLRYIMLNSASGLSSVIKHWKC